jgi:hypothetical protein
MSVALHMSEARGKDSDAELCLPSELGQRGLPFCYFLFFFVILCLVREGLGPKLGTEAAGKPTLLAEMEKTKPACSHAQTRPGV